MATRVLVVVDENLPPSAVTVLQTVLPPIVDEIIAVARSELQGASDAHLLEEIVRRLEGGDRRGLIVTRDKRFERDAKYTPDLPVDIVILQRCFSRGKKKSTRISTRPRLLARIRSAVRQVVKKAVA